MPITFVLVYLHSSRELSKISLQLQVNTKFYIFDKGSEHQVRLRSFNNTFKNHNKTLSDKTIPGLFLNDTLFLLGSRISTSYIPNNQDVHLDVFGLPGDKLDGESEISKAWCIDFDVPNKYQSLLKYQNFSNLDTALTCQVDCHNKYNASKEFHACGDPIPMTFIPMNSGDGNQADSTVLWRCNVSHYISKSDLHWHVGLDGYRSIRFQIGAHVRQMKDYTQAHHVTTFDIPLHTGVIGHGGPQIRNKEGYFSQQQHLHGNSQETHPQIGLCVTIYEGDAPLYLPEFVQHHKNIGISQIIIGLETGLDSHHLGRAEDALRPFIDEGFVVLQAMGLKDFFTCRSAMAQILFYQQCLYYCKGLFKYSASWDLDEYWMPPPQLEITGKSHFKYQVSVFDKIVEADNNTFMNNSEIKFIHHSDSLAFSRLATSDPFWNSSNYSRSISIQDVVMAVEKVYQHIGCENKWCYHTFPSFIVARMEDVNRTLRIRDDFLGRVPRKSGCWEKSVTQTQFAMMGGIHVPGSCKFPFDPEYHAFGKVEECYARTWPMGEFGRIHHYTSLFHYRDHDVNKSDLIHDEYSVLFADTVYKQLESLKNGL